ncbi:hypothetical protein GJT81_01035 [Enterobacteriaceae endosymbiont of Plateumaris consimilis]|uniref:hypothetical protein n=1 Tax=Enterobacteriaceae endosymbiont of Plateumaris consimilis TaxID=2675794 RepID=UPI001448E2C7|nr:hypothetical protein [Enterobacteriaceae endosymbiont of Plateumaris consimilis]QJC28606.1 hypothetical protein GJT81_01035 [Enterobacteriaceae endosymbiont of Plateumaris consimilis]
MIKKNNKYAFISISSKSDILFLIQKLIEYNSDLIFTKKNIFLKNIKNDIII